MQRKEYDLIAEVIDSTWDEAIQGGQATLRILTSKLARAFADHDTKFDPQRFTERAGF